MYLPRYTVYTIRYFSKKKKTWSRSSCFYFFFSNFFDSWFDFVLKFFSTDIFFKIFIPNVAYCWFKKKKKIIAENDITIWKFWWKKYFTNQACNYTSAYKYFTNPLSSWQKKWFQFSLSFFSSIISRYTYTALM